MWIGVSDRIRRVSTGWLAAATFLFFTLFAAWVLPRQASRVQATTGETRSPDLSFYYSAEELYQLASSYGEEGRAAYVEARFTFDLVWPLVYGSFLAVALSWAFRTALSQDSKWHRANLVPVLAVCLDYAENLSTSVVMARYPSATPVVDWLAGAFTMGKWILVAGSFLLLFAGLVAGISRKIKRRTGS